MKIVIATPVLFDRTSPFNHLFKDIIGGFLEDGNRVVRLAACEDRDDQDFTYGYTGSNIEYYLYRRKNSSHGNVFSRYLRDTFTNMREAAGILGVKDGDVLFEDVSYSSFWPVLAARLKGIPVIAMLQDVWPDNGVQSGLIKNGSVLYWYFEIWQRLVYRWAHRIICISDDMKSYIEGKGIDPDKIQVVYNWGYSDQTVDIPWEENAFVKRYGLNRDTFYGVYAGNIGKMQNVEAVVETARILQSRKDIHFIIVGEGANKQRIRELSRGLKNVTILPMQSPDLATSVYCAASVNLIPLVPGGLKTALPSKIGVCLSCGKPVLLLADEDSIMSGLIDSYGAGGTVDPRDTGRIAREIVNLSENRNETGNYRLFKEYFKRTSNIACYKKIVKETK